MISNMTQPHRDELIVRFGQISGRRILCQTPEDKELELREALCGFADGISANPGNPSFTSRAFPNLFEISEELHNFLVKYWQEQARQELTSSQKLNTL